MRKKDKLYTANRWNQPLFMQEKNENLFELGGPQTTNLAVNNGGYNFSGYSADFNVGKGLDFNAGKAIQTGGTGVGKPGINAGTAASAVSAVANVLNSAGGSSLLGGGYSTGGVGSGIATVGSMIGAGLSLVPGVGTLAGPLIALGSTVLGGLYDRGFGMKTDQKRLGEAKSSLSSLNNFNGNVESYDELNSPLAAANASGIYKGGWFSGRKARRKTAELQKSLDAARDYATRGLGNNVANLSMDQINNQLSNYAALGGSLDISDNNMSAIEYGLLLDERNRRAEKTANEQNKGIVSSLYTTTPNSVFALGGDVQMHGGDFNTGLTRNYSVGKIYDVSEAEANRLKSLGYEFTVVS